MYMKRILMLIAVNLAILGFIFGSFSIITARTASPTEAVDTAPGKVDIADVEVIMAEGMETERIMAEIQDAMALFPVSVVQSLSTGKWRIVVTSDLEEDGVTDFDTRIISILYGGENLIKTRTVHELAHVVDDYYGYPSASTDFAGFFEDDRIYVRYSYKDITTDDTASLIAKDNRDASEQFACSFSDYLLYPSYVRATYPDLWDFYEALIKS